jgi:hypothetical protein
VELELRRAGEDRRLYTVDGVGTLRFAGFLSRSATAEGDGRRWHIGKRGFWRSVIEATDVEGAVAGEFEPRVFRGGGVLRWDGRELTLRSASWWRSRFTLAEKGRDLATFEGKGWGRRPVTISVDDYGALEPGLVLFTAFVVRDLVENAAAAASGSSTAATS